MRSLAPSLSTLMASLLAGCSLFPSNIHAPDSVFSDKYLGQRVPPSQGGAINPALEYPGVMAAKLETDLVAAWSALNPPRPAEPTFREAGAVITAGIALIDHRCGFYFKELGQAAQKLAFSNKELGLTTGLVASLQGLTGVAAKDMALTGASLGFLGASSNAYGDVYIFSPDVASVETLVLNTQKLVKDEVKAVAPQDMTRGYAISVLQTYEKTCEVKTIRRLVNESVVSAKPVNGFDGGESAEAMEAFTRATLAKLFNVKTIAEDQLTVSYWLTFKDPSAYSTSTTFRSAIDKTMDGVAVNAYALTASAPINPASTPWNSVKASLEPLVAARSKSLDLRVAAYQGLALAPAPASPASAQTAALVAAAFRSADAAKNAAVEAQNAATTANQKNTETSGLIKKQIEFFQSTQGARAFFSRSQTDGRQEAPSAAQMAASAQESSREVSIAASNAAVAAERAASAAASAASAAKDLASRVPDQTKAGLEFGPSFNVRIQPGR